ncbi:MAG: hypothetical protein GX127_02315 [Eubacteriaceae bacterium]|jgi:glucitol operon activator protein|nr:hypothetical protein [Eubacteriaceae bacterium]
MDQSVLFLFGLLIVMMILRSVFTYLQYKNYRQTKEKLAEMGGILGVGARKSPPFQWTASSAIVLLVWDPDTDRVVACSALKGAYLWNRFKSMEVVGLSLEEIKKKAIDDDYRLNKKEREKTPYTAHTADPKRRKGALLQAVEAIEGYLKNQSKERPNAAFDRNKMREAVEKRKDQLKS